MQNKKSMVVALLSLTIISTIITTIASIISYRLGYCNAADEYIGASECKPMRAIKLFF